MSHYHVSGCKTEEFPAHITFLSVVQPEALGDEGPAGLSLYRSDIIHLGGRSS